MSDKDIVINDIDAGNTPCQVCFPRLVCQKETGKLNLIDQDHVRQILLSKLVRTCYVLCA